MQKMVFQWLAAEQREPGYLAAACGMSTERLTDLVCNRATPTDAEASAIAAVIGTSADALQQPPETPCAKTWFTVREAAAHLHVSTDTVYAMVRAGTVVHSRLGPRLIRIHRDDLERLHMTGTEDGGGRGSDLPSRRSAEADSPPLPPGRLL